MNALTISLSSLITAGSRDGPDLLARSFGCWAVPVPNIPGLKPFDVVNAKSPTIGQHSREILTELGYCESEILTTPRVKLRSLSCRYSQ